MSDKELERQHRLLRISFLVAACALLCVLVLIVIRTQQAPWRVLQERFLTENPGGAEALGIRQYYTCAAEVDRCPTCHLGIDRSDLIDESIPFRSEPTDLASENIFPTGSDVPSATEAVRALSTPSSPTHGRTSKPRIL